MRRVQFSRDIIYKNLLSKIKLVRKSTNNLTGESFIVKSNPVDWLCFLEEWILLYNYKKEENCLNHNWKELSNIFNYFLYLKEVRNL